MSFFFKPTITFDENPKKTYLPGDRVSGVVTVDNAKPLKARSVIINWSGTTKTWGIKLLHPSCCKTLFKKSEMVWCAKDGENELPAGKHEYPFCFVLPMDCPPTFKGTNGENKYKVEVEIDRPWNIKNRVVERFIVNRDMEFVFANDFPWTYRCRFNSGIIFQSGPVIVKCHMAKQVFKPGDPVNLIFDITNNSGSRVKTLFAQLGKRTHYHSRSQPSACSFTRDSCPLSVDHQLLKKTYYGKPIQLPIDLAPHSEGTYNISFNLPVRATQPSFESGLMSFGYFFGIGIRVANTLSETVTFRVSIGDLDEERLAERNKEHEALGLEFPEAPPAYAP
ncbi:hypothetical protein CRE_07678 [Caenorhabditis remanei]|uniref:Arrestin C-terminal-like domain-containing protein n=1 Tax=Caenorhabditis remanei TaxID=31234 RepID=E3MZV2_CAERE|nr:hypothetical protein CRE_07678 [Caenorhabditis remanei]